MLPAGWYPKLIRGWRWMLNNMAIDLQPTIANNLVSIAPLQEGDFEALYTVASDPLIWEQHPNKNRYQREVFQNFFNGAMESGGAFLVKGAATGEIIGSSRFYDWDEQERQIAIGYTFISRAYWGKGYNAALKTLMLNYAFKFADKVIFHIGANNIRSQKAIEKLQAVKVGEEEIAYYGEPEKTNFVYQITKADWQK
jgi:RimJ/RimL family protein N-acetyltransferase